MTILKRGRLTIIHTAIIMFVVVLCTITGCDQLKEDFTGGTEYMMQVETDQAVRRMTFDDRDRLMNLLKDSEVAFSTASLKDERTIEISGLNPQDETKIKEILDNNFREWDYQITGENATLSLKQDVVNLVKEQATLQALEVMKKRLSALGLSKEYIQRETPDSDRLKLRLPPDKQPNKVIGVMRMGGILEFRHVISGPFASKEEALNTFSGTLPVDLDILKTNPRGMGMGYYIVNAYPVITGGDLENARPSKDNYGSPNIAFTLASPGAAKFRNYTSKNIGQKLAIVLDNEILSAPVIQDVLSKEAVITGNFTVEEAEDMARILNSGALPAPVKILEEKTIEAKEK